MVTAFCASDHGVDGATDECDSDGAYGAIVMLVT